jgi:hypothetical protein
MDQNAWIRSATPRASGLSRRGVLRSARVVASGVVLARVGSTKRERPYRSHRTRVGRPQLSSVTASNAQQPTTTEHNTTMTILTNNN